MKAVTQWDRNTETEVGIFMKVLLVSLGKKAIG